MTSSTCRHQGLFVGLTTLDLIYQVVEPPKPNQKLVASNYIMAAGGPATNAAIAFQYLSQHPSLLQPSVSTQHRLSTQPTSSPALTVVLSVLGNHPIGQMVRADVEQWGVAIADLNPAHPDPVPTSSIMVTVATGERAVVSLNAVKSVALPEQIPDSIDALWNQIGVVLIDGHQMEVGEAIAHRAHQDGIPVVIDAGSWKPGFEKVLTYATYVLCSANFYPPGCETTADIHHFLHALDVPHVVITHGADPIDYWNHRVTDSTSPPQLIPVPTIAPVDTLGAGDIFHGAFCYYLMAATQRTDELPQDIPGILNKAARTASTSCEFFGPRAWMQ